MSESILMIVQTVRLLIFVTTTNGGSYFCIYFVAEEMEASELLTFQSHTANER